MNCLVMPFLSLYALFLSCQGHISSCFPAADLKHVGVQVNLHTFWILTAIETNEQKVPLRFKDIDEALKKISCFIASEVP